MEMSEICFVLILYTFIIASICSIQKQINAIRKLLMVIFKEVQNERNSLFMKDTPKDSE